MTHHSLHTAGGKGSHIQDVNIADERFEGCRRGNDALRLATVDKTLLMPAYKSDLIWSNCRADTIWFWRFKEDYCLLA